MLSIWNSLSQSSSLIDVSVVFVALCFIAYVGCEEHFDNRDYKVLPNYQPRIQQTLNKQTLLFGKSEGVRCRQVDLYLHLLTSIFSRVGCGHS